MNHFTRLSAGKEAMPRVMTPDHCMEGTKKHVFDENRGENQRLRLRVLVSRAQEFKLILASALQVFSPLLLVATETSSLFEWFT
jgi:hypothetical protein